MRSANQQCIKVDIFTDEAPFNINLSVSSKPNTQHSLLLKLYFIISALLFLSQATFGQRDTISINGVKFLTVRQTLRNDYDTNDTLLKLYRLVNGTLRYVFKHYLYKYGADAENEYKDIGTIQIHADSIILKTHYLQKGIDPIPEWRKRIYKVTTTGKVILVFDKYKQKNSNIWTKTDFEGD